uniref:GH25 family lysozyme n=1 Tax=Agathobacter sp. TaxID=2021311 RepID=UPI004055BFC8
MQDFLEKFKDGNGKKYLIVGSVVGILIIILIAIMAISGRKENEKGNLDTEQTEAMGTNLSESQQAGESEQEPQTEDSSETEDVTKTESEHKDSEGNEADSKENEDPQNAIAGNMSSQSGTTVKAEDVIPEVTGNETEEITYGIDVAKYQGTIDWKKVADANVDFAMVRVGYRTLKSGEIVADSNAKYNMQQAAKYGIKVGVYFFSTAITEAEAKEEADWVSDFISAYKITYPVAYNCEGYESEENRQYSLTKTQRTDIALAFMKRIAENGYSPMFYAAKSEMEADAKWEMSRIAGSYRVWVAQYPSVAYPQTAASSYSGSHDMWQYTNKGTVPGISKPVDMNIAYFGFRNTANAKGEENTQEEEADAGALMNFREVNETVTAKEKTNLRDKPSQGSDSAVKYTLENGETATRIAVSDSGWSKIVFNGQTYYAVSSYLTTDLSYTPPTSESQSEDDKIKTDFTEVNERVTAKDAVNLRTLPSVTNAESQVVVQIVHGDVITRTGINTDVGWSRVEYNGQVLYCVSSYLEVVTE